MFRAIVVCGTVEMGSSEDGTARGGLRQNNQAVLKEWWSVSYGGGTVVFNLPKSYGSIAILAQLMNHSLKSQHDTTSLSDFG